jgi:hypothetical protein
LAHALAGWWKGWLFFSHGDSNTSSRRSTGFPSDPDPSGATGTFAAAAGTASFGFVVFLLFRERPYSRWSTSDRLALLTAVMTLSQLLLLAGLRLEPYWHYFNSFCIGYFYLIWWGLRSHASFRLGARRARGSDDDDWRHDLFLAVHIHTHLEPDGSLRCNASKPDRSLETAGGHVQRPG